MDLPAHMQANEDVLPITGHIQDRQTPEKPDKLAGQEHSLHNGP